MHYNAEVTANVELLRPKLLRIAHRMLGVLVDAEDVVQEGFLRFHQAENARIENREAWLVSVVTRLAIDRLRIRQRERSSYVGQWLPEPWAGGADQPDLPDARSERLAELDYASLALLERLAPEERAAFLLRDVFSVDYGAVADALQRSEAATRQLVHRARTRVASAEVRRSASAHERRKLLAQLHAAVQAGDTPTLLGLLAPEVTMASDGGGQRFAARRVLAGVQRIARVLLRIAQKYAAELHYSLHDIDGEPALLSWRAGVLDSVTFVAADASGITAFYKLLNPAKLRRIGAELAHFSSDTAAG